MSNGSGSRFSNWASSGLLATFGWFLTLIIYCTFRAFKIEDPFLGQAFLLLTGLWVGNLTLAQGKKQAQTEKKAERAEQKADALLEVVDKAERRADESELRADAAEQRETGWSRHRDHNPEVDDE